MSATIAVRRPIRRTVPRGLVASFSSGMMTFPLTGQATNFFENPTVQASASMSITLQPGFNLHRVFSYVAFSDQEEHFYSGGSVWVSTPWTATGEIDFLTDGSNVGRLPFHINSDLLDNSPVVFSEQTTSATVVFSPEAAGGGLMNGKSGLQVICQGDPGYVSDNNTGTWFYTVQPSVRYLPSFEVRGRISTITATCKALYGQTSAGIFYIGVLSTNAP